MYSYIFDNFAQDQKNIKMIDKIELRITDLRIEGARYKTSISKDVSVLTKEALHKDAETLVIVGEDQSYYQAIAHVLKSGKNVVLGFIPLKKGFYADRLKIPLRHEACEVISKRNTVSIRSCRVNHFTFIFKAEVFDLSFFSSRGIFSFVRKNKIKNQHIFTHIQYDEQFNMHGDFSKMTFVNSDVLLKKRSDQHNSHFILFQGRGIQKEADDTHLTARAYHIATEKKSSIILDQLFEVKGDEFFFEVCDEFVTLITGAVS